MNTAFARKTRTLTTTAALALASVGLSGCLNFETGFDGETLAELDQSGKAPTEIGLAGPDDLVLVVGDTLDIQVDGDADAIEALRFKRSGDSLTVGRDGDWSVGMGKATVTITMPAPREISLAGSGDITAPALAQDADVSMAGSGKINLAGVSATKLEIDSAGSGSISGKGTATSVEINLFGSGNIDFADLKADKAEITIAGSGDVKLQSDGKVDASIAGSGSVYVTGKASCSSSVAGSGKLICKPA